MIIFRKAYVFGGNTVNVKLHDIDAYLCKVKDAIKKDNYQIANNS